MSNRKLGLLVALKSPDALVAIKAALADGNGARAAAKSLGIGRTTLTRWGESWGAVGKLLERYTLGITEAASLAGAASAAARKRRSRS